MSWKFKGNIVTEENTPDGAIGFVYKIIHIPTGKFYIGKKSLTSTRRLKPLKGKVRKRVVKKASDWEKYYSSNEWIKEQVNAGNAGDFEREIIQFCFSKKSLTYWEVWWQFKLDVLADPQSINENLMGKFFRKDIYINKQTL
jgi:hypothetical protein